MPLIITKTSVKCDSDNTERLALALSKICADGIGKPETYVASLVEDDATFAFGGEKADATLVEVRSIGGLNGNVNEALTQSICECVEAELGIPGDRVYVNFMDVPAANWGWNGRTFG